MSLEGWLAAASGSNAPSSSNSSNLGLTVPLTILAALSVLSALFIITIHSASALSSQLGLPSAKRLSLRLAAWSSVGHLLAAFMVFLAGCIQPPSAVDIVPFDRTESVNVRWRVFTNFQYMGICFSAIVLSNVGIFCIGSIFLYQSNPQQTTAAGNSDSDQQQQQQPQQRSLVRRIIPMVRKYILDANELQLIGALLFAFVGTMASTLGISIYLMGSAWSVPNQAMLPFVVDGQIVKDPKGMDATVHRGFSISIAVALGAALFPSIAAAIRIKGVSSQLHNMHPAPVQSDTRRAVAHLIMLPLAYVITHLGVISMFLNAKLAYNGSDPHSPTFLGVWAGIGPALAGMFELAMWFLNPASAYLIYDLKRAAAAAAAAESQSEQPLLSRIALGITTALFGKLDVTSIHDTVPVKDAHSDVTKTEDADHEPDSSVSPTSAEPTPNHQPNEHHDVAVVTDLAELKDSDCWRAQYAIERLFNPARSIEEDISSTPQPYPSNLPFAFL
ncbi:hypothetical protein GQ42DRAFT_156023 [Ramicandelaber brevisporus]|nr:hypothetical protein GQ42DRAFT_156023 [Ramicandelaber brevisporus]